MSTDYRRFQVLRAFIIVSASLVVTFAASPLYAIGTTITSFSPTGGVAGTVVTITGTGLTGTLGVSFNGTPAAAFHQDSSTQITATAPHGMTSGAISVTGLFGTVTSTDSFTIPMPVIDSFSPRKVVFGTVVYITGSNFTDANAVYFKLTPSPLVNVLSDSEIVTSVPAGAISGYLYVSTIGGGVNGSPSQFLMIPGLIANPDFESEVAAWIPLGGASPLATLTWNALDADGSALSGSALLTNQFDHLSQDFIQCAPVTAGTRYTAGARVFVPSGQSETGIASISILWYDALGCSSFVMLNNHSDEAVLGRAVGQWTSPFVNAVAPAGAQSAAFAMSVWPDHAATTTSFRAHFDDLYFDAERAPSVTSFSPTVGAPGTVITIDGNDFYGTSSVVFNHGFGSLSFEIKNSTRIVATVPGGATTGPITITGPGGSGTSAANFRVLLPPTITAVQPAFGYVGDSVQILGTDLDIVTTVRFNGVVATFGYSPTPTPRIQAQVPVGATSGPLTIENIAGTGSFPFALLSPRGDINGDGKADLTWRHLTAGANYLWTMDGATLTSAVPLFGVPDTAWKIVGSGDFNGDGFTDLLWRRDATGEIYVWLMNGATIADLGPLPTVADPLWKPVAIADFNGDGKADIFWRRDTGENYLWLMNGRSVLSATAMPTVADPDWKVVAAADFDYDGRADLFWRHASTGANYMWRMLGTIVLSMDPMPTVADLNWKVVAAGDFDGDRHGDLFWRRDGSGDNYVWLVVDNLLKSSFAMTGVADTNWKVVAAGDFNGDQKTDLFWRRDGSGDNYMWLMNGSTFTGAPVTGVPDLNWTVVAPPH